MKTSNNEQLPLLFLTFFPHITIQWSHKASHNPIKSSPGIPFLLPRPCYAVTRGLKATERLGFVLLGDSCNSCLKPSGFEFASSKLSLRPSPPSAVRPLTAVQCLPALAVTRLAVASKVPMLPTRSCSAKELLRENRGLSWCSSPVGWKKWLLGFLECQIGRTEQCFVD